MSPERSGLTVVVGYDGSDQARAAVDLAIEHARPGGRVFIVCSYALPSDFRGYASYDQVLAERQAHAREVMDELVDGTEALRDVDFETELLGGPPAEAVAEVARAREADEIVVGSRGLGRFRGALGSVSHALLHLADRPVVVVPGDESR